VLWQGNVPPVLDANNGGCVIIEPKAGLAWVHCNTVSSDSSVPTFTLFIYLSKLFDLKFNRGYVDKTINSIYNIVCCIIASDI